MCLMSAGLRPGGNVNPPTAHDLFYVYLYKNAAVAHNAYTHTLAQRQKDRQTDGPHTNTKMRFI